MWMEVFICGVYRRRCPAASFTKRGSARSVAFQTERADVREIAFSAALNHGHDVIRIPKTTTNPALDVPVEKLAVACRPAQAHDGAPFGKTVDPAGGANPFVPIQYLLAQVTGIGPQFPFLDAKVGAEGEPAFRNLETAPAAQEAPVGPFRNCVALSPAAGHDACGTHRETF